MISGNATTRTAARALHLGLLLSGAAGLTLPCLATPAEPAAALDAAGLIGALKRSPPARTAYTEVRFSGLLERPLILRGELAYLGPGELGKRVDTPYREDTRIADGVATVQRGERAPRTFSLGQAPELEGFLRGFSALLGGDAATLAQDFELSASGQRQQWRLRLQPRDPRLARRISAIEVDGAGDTARCFRTLDADGDVSVLLVDALAATPIAPRVSPMRIDALCRGVASP